VPDPVVALAAAMMLAVAMILLWLLSLRLADASIADIFWGVGFVLVAGLACWLGQGAIARKILITSLTATWGLRLAFHLAWRNHGRGEDPRYAAMRAQHPQTWNWLSLFQVFGLQGALIWLVSLPLQIAQSAPAPAQLVPLDAAGAALVLLGITFEAVGDYQLARFKANPAHRGRVMDQGLWRYTRHPNYFGDFCVWWGLYAIAAAAGGALWCLVSPLVMAFLLMRVSGVPLLERTMAQRPGYAQYVARTSSFFPRPPRK
jgi:steroid 5-alpha reductase family enzyme